MENKIQELKRLQKEIDDATKEQSEIIQETWTIGEMPKSLRLRYDELKESIELSQKQIREIILSL